MKELIVEMMRDAGLNDPSAIGTVRAMTTLEELYDAWGKVTLREGGVEYGVTRSISIDFF